MQTGANKMRGLSLSSRQRGGRGPDKLYVFPDLPIRKPSCGTTVVQTCNVADIVLYYGRSDL